MMAGSTTCWKFTHDPDGTSEFGSSLSLSAAPIEFSLASLGSIFHDPENFFIIPCFVISNTNCNRVHVAKKCYSHISSSQVSNSYVVVRPKDVDDVSIPDWIQTRHIVTCDWCSPQPDHYVQWRTRVGLPSAVLGAYYSPWQGSLLSLPSS